MIFYVIRENKAIIRKGIEAVNKRNLAMLDEVYTPDFVDNFLQVWSLESFKDFLTELFEGFPDFHITIEDIVAEGDKVCVYVTETMTHRGEFEGIAPTGKKITYPSIWIIRIVDGKMVKREGFGNDLDYYKQLGVIEYTKKESNSFQKMSSNCFHLHFSNPHVYQVSSKSLYTNIKQDEAEHYSTILFLSARHKQTTGF